jgi:hypothetical protein
MNEFPINFREDEYDPRLGVFQKWLHGNKTQKIYKMYSMSAFQAYYPKTGFVIADYQKYAEYLYIATTTIISQFDDWYIRVYIDESIFHPGNSDNIIWRTKLQLLMQYDRVQIICVKFPQYYMSNRCHKELLPVMFRYLSLFDETTSIILFRDVDNIYTSQHEYLIQQWIKQGYNICLFMNEKYRRQELEGLTENDVILKDEFCTSLLSGLWNIKKPTGFAFPKSMWQKIFAYVEETTLCTSRPEYVNYKYYATKFLYGFDELAITKVCLPIFVDLGMTFQCIPVKIYDANYIANMFENTSVTKFLRNLSDEATLRVVKKIMIQDYWVMFSETAGLAQYMLCILTNIYFGIITKQSKFYTNEVFINNVKNKIIPNLLLMSIGNFVFKNFKKYNWYPMPGKATCGSLTVTKFLETNQKITLLEWTAGTYVLDPSGDPIPPPPPPPVDPPNDGYGI